YDPRRPNEQVDLERADYWIGNGAQPSETVASIIQRARQGKSLSPAPKPERPVVDTTKKPVTKTEPKAEPKAAEPKAEPAAAPAAEAPAADAPVAEAPAAETASESAE